ncbi:MAG: DUF5711 family protein [Lachnospiraceae bacterium]|nr:DUF5711 family protein [Lachnospiraceae bacterium]
MADIRQFVKKDGRAALLKQIGKGELVKEGVTNPKKILPPVGKVVKRGIGIVLIMVLFLTGIHFYEKNRTYTGYDVLTLTELTESGNMTYITYGDYILRYSMDGISCLDKNGVLIWGQAYEIKNPIIDLCKDYVAVAGQKENSIYLFNRSGSQGAITTEYPITSISVASQGVVAAVLENNGTNYIKIYDKNGKELVGMKTFLERNGYPMSVDLSEDGRKLVVSLIDIAENELENSLVFYNFSEVGQNYIEKLVGGYSKKELGDVLIPEVVFLDNTIVCAFADSRLIFFRMKEIPELIQIVEIEKEIHSVFYSGENVGIVLNDTEAGGVYLLQIYDKLGKLTKEVLLEQDYKNISFAEDQVILYNDNSVCIYSLDGDKKFEYTFEKNIILFKQIIGFRYVWVNSSSINDIRLK